MAVSLQSCPALCDPMDCSPPGSPVHGILQARILEWAAISFSRGSSRPRDQICVSCIADGFFTTKPPEKPHYDWGFLGSSVVKNTLANAGDPGDTGLIPGSGRSPKEGNSYPLQYSYLENPMDRGAWWAAVHGLVRVGHDLVTKPPPSQVKADF